MPRTLQAVMQPLAKTHGVVDARTARKAAQTSAQPVTVRDDKAIDPNTDGGDDRDNDPDPDDFAQ